MESPKGTAKLRFYLNLEQEIQQKWEKERVNQIDPDYKRPDKKDKMLVTFPFPYTNGRAHLGHSFSLSKAEVSSLSDVLKTFTYLLTSSLLWVTGD